jgi:hypothetical protein
VDVLRSSRFSDHAVNEPDVLQEHVGVIALIAAEATSGLFQL